MGDGTVEEPLSSQESLPLSQETFDYLWEEYVIADQFHSLERIPSLENVDNSFFESTTVQESHPDTEVVSVEQINITDIVTLGQNSVSSSSAAYMPSSLPASQNWTGLHDFNVSFGPQEKNTKGVSWTYSGIKDKLYVRKDAPCPINFSAKSIMSGHVVIRAMALYSSPEHASEVVHRCVNHSMMESSEGVFEAKHLVRCESQMADYKVDLTTKRHSVIVPFENPPAGQQFSTYIYKFTCFGSCTGGPNRRPLMLIFSLEEDGKVIGRRKFDVKICACPGRDKKTEEKQSVVEVTPEMPLKRKEKEMISLCDALDFTKSIYLPPVKKKKSNMGPPYTVSDPVEFLKIIPSSKNRVTKIIKMLICERKFYMTDQRCYEFLKNMKKLFDMCKAVNNLPPNIKALINSQKNNRESD